MFFGDVIVMGPTQITPRQAAYAVLAHWLNSGPMTLDQLATALSVTRSDVMMARQEFDVWSDFITETEEDLKGESVRVLMPSRTFLRSHILAQRATIEKLSKNTA